MKGGLGTSLTLERGSREDVSAAVGCLALPSLVLVGEEDATLPPAVIERDVMPALARAELVTMFGAGHLLPLEAPDEVADRLGEFAGSIS